LGVTILIRTIAILIGKFVNRLEESWRVPANVHTLGTLLRGLRDREGLTLKQMSEKSGIPVSTLSKVEHDRLTLTYDKLQQLSPAAGHAHVGAVRRGRGVSAPQAVMARRSLGDVDRAIRVQTPNYEYFYLCTELRGKRMIPVITKIRAHSAEQFGDLVRHAGEEYIFVLKGRVVVNTEFYDPVVLEAGQSIYLDSSMGHAYLAAEGCDEADVLGVMSSEDEELMKVLLDIHEDQKQTQR
jgi:transcriptional regulator with XRE-family HTH domain